MSYRAGSLWNEKNEIRCLSIYRQLQEAGFPRGAQAALCRDMSKITGLSPGSISAKVCNYKSLGGVNAASNVSVNSTDVFRRFGALCVEELKALAR
jgi:hypothetical protein